MRWCNAVIFSFFLAAGAAAQDYPARPVTIVVPQAAGGANDILGRIVAQQLSQSLGQQFVVENRVGAGGNIGTAATAKAPRDGYTLLFTISAAHAVNPTLYAQPGFDPVKDFDPVMLVATVPFLLVVNQTVPASSVAELIALAKKEPGKIAYGSSGNGTTNHLLGEMFKSMAGVDMLHVPYRGGGPALTDLLAGQVPVMFDTLATSIEHIRAGKLRALAVTSATRSNVLPEIPAVAEFVPGYEAIGWQGLGAPRGTPAAIIDRLNKEINAGLADPQIKARIADLGYTVFANSPADFGKFVVEYT
jgi:tripartite-type tricarboxylate transporter receptor subunit TctC